MNIHVRKVSGDSCNHSVTMLYFTYVFIFVFHCSCFSALLCQAKETKQIVVATWYFANSTRAGKRGMSKNNTGHTGLTPASQTTHTPDQEVTPYQVLNTRNTKLKTPR